MTPEQVTSVATLPATTEELEALIRKVYKEEREAEKAGKKILTLEEMRKALEDLPDSEILRDYETTVAKEYADHWAPQCVHGDLVTLIDLIKQNPPKDSVDWKVAFGAFAVAVNFERLSKNVTAEKKLLDDYKAYFAKDHVFFLHLELLYGMDLVDGMDMKDPQNAEFLKDLLNKAKINSENLAGNSAATGNYGGYHAFAELTAHLFETAMDSLRPFLTDPKSKWLEHARDAANMAIASNRTYAKYYCTYARVLAQLKEWDEAIFYVSQAIDLEDSTRSNYAIRIGDYTSYRQQFRAQQMILAQKAALDAKVQDVSQQMDNQEKNMSDRMEAQEKETMAKNMEFLGLFSGIVSFTIGSLTLASNFQAADAIKIAGLIVVLLGALLCVFSAFGMILHGFIVKKKDHKTKEEKRSFICRHIVVFALGVLIVIGGIVFCIK